MVTKFYERERFEHELINRRLTWLLTSQTILFAAYGVALPSGPNVADIFLKVTAISGTLIAGLILLGVLAAILAKAYCLEGLSKDRSGRAVWRQDVDYLSGIGWISYCRLSSR